MSAATDQKQMTPQEYLHIFYGVLRQISDMIRDWHLHPAIQKGERSLSAEEHMELYAVQILLTTVCGKLSTAPQMVEVFLHQVCRSPHVLRSLQQQGFHTLADLWALDVGQFYCVLDRAGAADKRQWHMYLFARTE